MHRYLSLRTVVLALATALATGCADADSSTPPDIVSMPEAPPVQEQNAVAGVPEGEIDFHLPDAILPPPLTSAELQEGWISLFDGATLFGWQAGNDANWRVEESTIVVDEGSQGLLCTTSEFTDYVLRVEFNSAAETNSGIFLRTGLQSGDPADKCYELNIAPADNPFPTGSLVKRQKVDGDLNQEGWQAYEVTVQGDRVQVKLDGKQVLDYTDPNPLPKGRIGLQLNEGRVAFRNIYLKPLGNQSIFNGKDLSGWKTYPEMASKFTVTDEGYLHVKDGRGQLETEGLYGDFVLQLECVSHAPNLNSGIFFRCIPGDVMMGYECQIDNEFLDDDRTKPEDCGTGGIFRRRDARILVANDLEWFHLTLVVSGSHMASWVNGVQVCEWTDQRPADPNPRQGLRTEAGTIMIQGHDPTTDLSFRNLRVSDL